MTPALFLLVYELGVMMIRFLLALVFLSAITINFQNCSNANFSVAANSAGSSDDNQVPPGNDSFDNPDDPGIDGGHFDLDTSHLFYAFDHGKTDKHVHEYDDKYNVTYADYFNLLDSGFTKIPDVVPAAQPFIIIIANAQLSPAATLEINGTNYPVAEYQRKVADFMAGAPALTTFTLSQLTSLKIKIRPDAIKTGGIIPTQTSCVVSNKMGAKGEYRDGALTLQILNAQTVKLDATTKSATADGGLLWESTIFWHEPGGVCY